MSAMRRLLVHIAVLSASVSCGGGGAVPPPPDAPPERLVFLEIRGLAADPRLPSGFLGTGPVQIAAARLAEDRSVRMTEPAIELAASCVRSDRLVLLVDCPVPYDGQGRDNISITTVRSPGSLRSEPSATPPDLLGEISAEGWESIVERQETIRGLADRFGPDVIIARCSTGSVDTALAVGSRWLESVSSGGGNLVVISPPSGGWYRGWVVLAGPGIVTSSPAGLTPSGVLNTAALLAGLDPVLRLSQGVPAIGSMIEGGKILP